MMHGRQADLEKLMITFVSADFHPRHWHWITTGVFHRSSVSTGRLRYPHALFGGWSAWTRTPYHTQTLYANPAAAKDECDFVVDGLTPACSTRSHLGVHFSRLSTPAPEPHDSWRTGRQYKLGLHRGWIQSRRRSTLDTQMAHRQHAGASATLRKRISPLAMRPNTWHLQRLLRAPRTIKSPRLAGCPAIWSRLCCSSLSFPGDRQFRPVDC